MNDEMEDELSLWSLFNKSKLTDCILALPKDNKEGEEEEEENEGEFKLHKLILASYSRYCYNKIIPPEGDEGDDDDGVVVSSSQDGVHKLLLFKIPILPDPHVNRDELIKCISIINTFMYTHGDWERAILLNQYLKEPSSEHTLEGRKPRNCDMILTLFGLSLILDIPTLTTPLAQHIINTYLSSNNASTILLRCSYYIDNNNKDANMIQAAAEDILRDKFEECMVEGLGKPLKVFDISQLPLDTINRVLGSNKLGLKGEGDERIVLRTCTNVLRQRMNRNHNKVKVEIVKPRDGAVKVIVRIMEGIASRSECVRGCPVPRYETSYGLVGGSEGDDAEVEVDVICPIFNNAPLGEVWLEIEWIGESGEITRDKVPKEVLQKSSNGGEEEEEEGKEVELTNGGTVRVTILTTINDGEKGEGEVDGGKEEQGEEEEDDGDDNDDEGEEESSENNRKTKNKKAFRVEGSVFSVRWSQLPLEALISAAESPLWHLAQDRILELMRRFTKAEAVEDGDNEQEEGKGSKAGGGPRDCQRKGYKSEESREEINNNACTSRGSAALTASPATPISFSYSSDFDTFGCLYWLGTRGHTIPWRNPCSKLMEVQVTASSVGRGSVDEIVGRSSSVEFRTRNEPASWVQVDFGRGRELRLTGYCLRNRNSSAQCLMNWNIMGSNDGDDWILIDDRKMCGNLREPKVTSYFPLDKSPESRGSFRIFRLIQSGVNSGNTHNLFLAGIEFYGEATTGEW